jgi:hypothetical protein
MPLLTRYFLKTAILYFVASSCLGGYLLIAVGLQWNVPLVLQPVYWHMLLVGWLMQLIFGVAYWMFPPFAKGQPHRYPALAWFTYAALNVGLLLRVVVEPWHGMRPQPGLGWLLVCSAVLQVAAGWMFLITVWTRIRGRGR